MGNTEDGRKERRMNLLGVVVASALGHILGRLLVAKIDEFIMKRYMNDTD